MTAAPDDDAAGDDPDEGEQAVAADESDGVSRQTTLAEPDEWGSQATGEGARELIVGGITQNAENIEDLEEDVASLTESVARVSQLLEHLDCEAPSHADTHSTDGSSGESLRGYY